MAYQKTVWESREGDNLDKFTKLNETADTVVLINTPDSITRGGTLLSPQNMNKIEGGIEAAHTLIATETSERKTADLSLQSALQAEYNARTEADQGLGAALQNEHNARTEADQGLGAALQNEHNARTEADQGLGAALQTEYSERTAADQNLQEQINTLQNIGDMLDGESLTEILAAKQDKITATGPANILLAPTGPGGQPGTIPLESVAPIESPAFTGTPKVPSKTSAATSGGTLIATEAQVALKANLASPTFTGTPKVPSKTSAAASDGTLIATEAQVALKANLASPTFTGTPKVPSKTSAATSDGTLIATEAQVALKANLASPALTGTPTAPTAAAKNNSTQIATTAYADRAGHPVSSYYTQYPVTGQSTIANMFPSSESPATLFGGTWSECFAGEEVFFKTLPSIIEANRGKRYNTSTLLWDNAGITGIQGDAIRNILAALDGRIVMEVGASGAFYLQQKQNGSLGGSDWPTHSLFFDTSRVVPVDTEIHPKNRLIKVWKKTAN